MPIRLGSVSIKGMYLGSTFISNISGGLGQVFIGTPTLSVRTSSAFAVIRPETLADNTAFVRTSSAFAVIKPANNTTFVRTSATFVIIKEAL